MGNCRLMPNTILIVDDESESPIVNAVKRRLNEEGWLTQIIKPEASGSLGDEFETLALYMIETDSPYLAPEPLRGNPNEPANLRHIGIFLSKLLDVEEAELAATTTRNTQQFYGLPE